MTSRTATPSTLRRRVLAAIIAMLVVGAGCGDAGEPTDPGARPTPAGTTSSTIGTPSTFPPPVAEPSADLLEAIEFFGRPLALDGENPFDALPPADECQPEFDSGAGDAYFPLTDTDGRPTEPTVEGAEVAQTRILVNEKGQRFEIVVNGLTTEAVENFIATASMCVERLPDPGGPPASSGAELELALLAVTIEATGVSLSDLVAWRDELAAEGPTSLAAMLMEAGIDPVDVVEAALDRRDFSAYDDPEGARARARRVFVFLAVQEGAPMIVLVAPPDAPDLSGDSVLVDILPSDGERGFVFLAIDPAKNRGWVYYRARCTTSVWAQIRAWSKSMRLYVGRSSPWQTIGTRYVNSVWLPRSSWVHASYSTPVTADINVYVYRDTSQYSVYGGWSEGSGGGC